MRTVLFVLALLLSFSAFAQGSKIESQKVPSLVKNTLQIVYPGAESVSWFVDSIRYTASFVSGVTPVKVVIHENGFWQETIWGIEKQNAPAKITEYCDSAYAGYKINEIVIIENAFDGQHYLVMLKKGSKQIQLWFTLRGEFEKEILNS